MGLRLCYMHQNKQESWYKDMKTNEPFSCLCLDNLLCFFDDNNIKDVYKFNKK